MPLRPPPALRSALLALLCVLLLTGTPAVLWGGALLGAGTADIWGHSWTYWWTWEALSSGAFPLHGAPLRHPDGQSWWIIDLPVALLLTPITALFGAGLAYNAAALGHVALGAGGLTAWLTRRGVSIAHATCAGVLAATSPFVRGALTSGVPEALVVLLAPAYALALEAGLRRGGRALLGAGLLGALLCLDGAYGGLIGGLVGATVTGALLVERLRVPDGEAGSPGLGRRALRAALAALPAGAAVAASKAALDATAHPALTRDTPIARHAEPWWALQASGGADLASLALPAPLLPLEIAAPTDHRHVVFVGAVLLLGVLASLRWRAARAPAALALAAALLSLGPVIRLQGTGVAWSPPAQVLSELGARNLYRVAGLLPVAGLAALALAWHRRRMLWAVWLAVAVEGLWLAPIPLQLPVTPDPTGAVEAWLAAQPEPGAVLDLPLDHEGTAARGTHPQQTLHLQTSHGRPIASGLYPPAFSEELPGPLRRLDHAIVVARKHAHQAAQGGRGRRPDVPVPPPPPGAACARMKAELRDAGFAFVTLRGEAVPADQQGAVRAWVEACFGAPSQTAGDRSAWRIGPP